MSTSAVAPRTSAGAIFVFGCAIVTGFFGVAIVIFEELPRAVGVVAAVVTGLAGIVSAYCTMRPRHRPVEPMHSWPPPSGHPYGVYGGVPRPAAAMPAPGPPRASGVRPFWLGATVVFGLLSLAFAPSALVMIFTGLLAFRRPKAAAGVAVALTVVVLAGLALVLLSYLFDYQASVPATPYELCLAQGYDPYTCAYYS